MATAAPNPIDDFTDIQFKRHNTSQLFRGDPSQFNQCNLLATASLYGLVIVGSCRPELQVVRLSAIADKSGDNIEARTVPLGQPAHAIALSCDHSMLAVNYAQNGSTFLSVYAVPSLLSSNITVMHHNIVLSPDTGVAVREFLWNPVIPGTLAVCLDNGLLCVLNFNAAGYELHTLGKAEQAQCASWSPKGKQIVVGFPYGKLAQYKPDLQLARTIPCTDPNVYPGGPFDIVTVQWLSTYQFAAAFLRRAAGECPAIFIVNAAKNVSPVYVNYEDICYSQSGPRRAQVFFAHILPWNLLLVGSANSMEIGVLGTREAGETPVWQQYTMADEFRAEVPLTADKQDSYPIGVAVETGCTHQLTENEVPLPVMPMLHLLSTGGHLASFDLVNRMAGAPTLCQSPKAVMDVSGAIEFRRVVLADAAAAPAAAVSSLGAPQAANINDMTFMVPGNAATSTPAVAQKSKPSMFTVDAKPVNLFGDVAAADKKPSFGLAPPPNYGGIGTSVAPSLGAFGTSAAPPAMTTAAPATSNLPSFGGFGGIATNGSAAPSPFGSSAFGVAKPMAFGQAPAAAVSAAVPVALPAPQHQQQQQQHSGIGNSDQQPFLTVGQSYTHSAPKTATPTRSAGSVGISSAGSGGDDEKVIRRMIAEEMTTFEADIARMLARSRELRIELGTKDEMAAVAKQLAELQDISGQATESTDTLTLEIQSLQLALTETFAMVTEAQTKRTMFNNMDVNTLRDTSTMSQTNRRQMERLLRQLAINEHQFDIVSKQMDAQWAAHELKVRHTTRAKMRIPQLENVYMTMSKQREILNTQKQRIAYIKSKIGYRASNASAHSNGDALHRSASGDTSVNALSESIFSMSLCDQVKLQTERMAPAKMAALRELLRTRTTITVIKPCRPERKGLSSEVVLERKIAHEKAAATRTTKVAAVTTTTSTTKQGTPTKVPTASAPPQVVVKPKASVAQQPAARPNFGATTAPPAGSFSLPPPAQSVTTSPMHANNAKSSPAPNASQFGNGFAAQSPQASQSFGFKAPEPTAALSFGGTNQPAFGGTSKSAFITATAAATTTAANAFGGGAAPFASFTKPLAVGGNTSTATSSSSSSVTSTPAPLSFGFANAATSGTPAFGGFSSGSAATQSVVSSSSATAAPPAFSFGSSFAPSTKPQTPTLNALLPKGIAAAAAAASAASPDVTPAEKTGHDKENQPIAPAPVKPVMSIFGGATTITPSFGASQPDASGPTKSTTAFGGLSSAFGSSLPASTVVSVVPSTTTATTTSGAAFSLNSGTTITVVKPAATTAVTAVASAANVTSPAPPPVVVPPKTATVETTTAAPAVASFSFSLGGSTAPSNVTASAGVPTTQSTSVDKTDTLFGSLNVCSPNVTSASSATGTGTTSLFSMPAFGVATAAAPAASIFGGGSAATNSPFGTGSNLFGSVPASTAAASSSSAASSTTTNAPASSFGNVFGGNVLNTPSTTAASPAGNIFGGGDAASIFASGPVASPAATSTNIFGSPVAAPVPSATAAVGATNTPSSIFGGAIASPVSGGSIFGGGGASAAVASPAATSAFGGAPTGGSIFGQSAFGQSQTNVFSQAAAGAGANAGASSGGSMFGSSSIFGGGGGGNAPASTGGGSIFGGNGGALAPSAFGGNMFGSPAAGAASSSAFGAAPSIFSSPSAGGGQAASGGSIFDTSGGGGAAAGAFGGTAAFGAPPSFGGAASFGSPKGGFGAFGQSAVAAPAFASAAGTQSGNSLFESLGSSETGMTFGNIAQGTATAPLASQQQQQQQQPQSSAFGGGSSFSSWR